MALSSLFVLSGCGLFGNEDPEPIADPGDDDPGGFDSGMFGPSGIVPEFVGVSLQMAFGADGVARNYNVGTAMDLPPLVTLTFATPAYFDQTSLAGLDAESCGVNAVVVDGTVPLDFATVFTNEDDADTFQAYDFVLSVDPDTSDCPDKVDESVLGENAADLLGRWDGATIGIAFAPQGSNSDLDSIPGLETDDGTWHQYVALPEPDGTRVAYAASVGATFEFDEGTGDIDTESTKDITGLDPIVDQLGVSAVTSVPFVFRNLAIIADDLTQ
ncbi:MAG: hypothetical protein AAF211_02270 [Myxococcota bacterium]